MTPTERARRIALLLGRHRVTADAAAGMAPRLRVRAAWEAGVLPLGADEWGRVVATLAQWDAVGELTADKTERPPCTADAP